MTRHADSNRIRHRIDRRTLLTGITTSAVALGGCLSTNDTDDDPKTSDVSDAENETFETIAWDGPTLTVTLASDVDASHVDLVDPSGATFRRDHPQDTSEVAYTLLGEGKDGYPVGDYQLVASDGESRIDETTLTLEPELMITDVKRGKDHPDMDWDKESSSWEDRAALEIENTGTAPSYLESVQWTDAPLTRVLPEDTSEFYHNILLPADASKTVYAANAYATEAIGYSGLECGELDTSELTVTAIVQAGSNPSYSQTIRYGGSQHSCEIEITGGGPIESDGGGV